MVMWSCSTLILPKIHTYSTYVYHVYGPTLYFQVKSHNHIFSLHYLLLCDAAVAVIQSEGLLLWKVCSVVAVILVATASALSTGLGTEVILAYIVVVSAGVRMLFTCFITKAARSLYSREQQYQVSL